MPGFIFVLTLAAILSFCFFEARAETGDKTSSSPKLEVYASMLVAGPGELIYQSTGHSAIRLQCPGAGLDNVFTYEANEGSIVSHLIGKSKGRYVRISFADYLAPFQAEHRYVKSLPLNLTDSQIRRLWQLLDEASESGTEDGFNMRRTNCNSKAMEKITESLGDRRIVMNEDSVENLNNASVVNLAVGQHSPWHAFIINCATGAGTDGKDPWQTRMVPVLMERYFSTAEIEDNDGNSRPLLSGEPTVIYEPSEDNRWRWPHPGAVFGLLLAFVCMISVCEIRGCFLPVVRIADYVLLGLQSMCSVLLLVLAVVPAGVGDGWNWLFIPLNPLPLIVLFIFHKKTLCRKFFTLYGFACALFVLAPLVTAVADINTSMLSLAIAVRVLTHLLSTYKQRTPKQNLYKK